MQIDIFAYFSKPNIIKFIEIGENEKDFVDLIVRIFGR